MTLKEQLDELKDPISEVGMIGTLLINPDFILRTEYFQPRMFGYMENSTIFYIIKNLYNKGITEIDDFMIISEIEGNKKLKAIFDNLRDVSSSQEYISDCKMVGRSTYEEYRLLVHRVMALSFKREAITKMNSLMKTCLADESNNFNDINMTIQEEISILAEKYIADDSIQTIGEKLDDIVYEIESRQLENGLTGLPSRWDSINERFTYENGDLYIVGGRPKAGKSMFYMNEVIHKLKNGVPCAIFDTELSDRKWFERFASSLAGVEIRKYKAGTLTDEENARVAEQLKWLRAQPLVHIYDSSWTKEKIFTKAKILKLKIGLGFLVYDYIKADDVQGLEIQEHNYLGDMTNFLKNKVAGALDIPVLAGAQMSPKSNRLADSDKINRYASYICYWMKKTHEEVMEDGAEAGTHKFFIDYARDGGEMYEGEYLNFILKGDYGQIYQAPVPRKKLGDLPFLNKDEKEE